MTISIIDHESLFERLASGLTLVTGNSRLARVLTGQYGQWRVKRGDRQWRSPDILSWDAWLDKLWEAASLQGCPGTDLALPGGRQLLSLWQNVLRDDPRARQLLRPESLAARLRDTRRLAIEWRLDLRHASWFGDDNENHSAFVQWNRSFEALCQRQGWIAPEDRIAPLCLAVNQLTSQFTAMGFLGFDEFSPAQQELLSALVGTGHEVHRLAITPAQSRARLWQSRDRKEELQNMARWVRYWFEKEPGSRIAVVVPDLQARRLEIERHLGEILTPGNGGANSLPKPWNTSMGIPLARVPMVESAFDVLRLLDRRILIQDIGRVLRSPWIKGAVEERNSRALLEKCLRENYPRQLKLSELRYRAGEIRKHDRNHVELPPDQYEARPWNSPVLANMINTLSRFQRENQGVRAPSAWAEAIDGLLSRLGWPAAIDLDAEPDDSEHSEIWQAYQTWQEELRKLASLDATIGTLGCQAAINQLQQICRERIFQPRTPPATIQVLGLYEASGLRFDHLWVLGLHNDNWPPPAQPNPFIPGLLQKKVQLPHSSPKRELDVALSITSRLLETAPDCIFSYPGQVDGEDMLPSPLLTGEPFQSTGAPEGWQGENWQKTIGHADSPVTAPLLFPGPPRHGTARGGSSILKNQALCPFRAFASNRLGATGLETPADGISPKLHGSLMHRVLENFWTEIRSHRALTSLNDDELEVLIRRHVDQVVNEERSLMDRAEFREVEGNRLARLTFACLELEKAREPFEVVGFEKEMLQEIEGQPIRLVIDRIDHLPDGESVIIDYKTGRVDPKKWFGDRPEDPQLPLYAISAEATPAAIAFAVIRDEECLYRGVVTSEGIFPGLPPRPGVHTAGIIEAGQNIQVTIDTWRSTLHRLMAEFLAGNAEIDPKNGRKTCINSYCELQPLCRITELEQLRQAREQEAAS